MGPCTNPKHHIFPTLMKKNQIQKLIVSSFQHLFNFHSPGCSFNLKSNDIHVLIFIHV